MLKPSVSQAVLIVAVAKSRGCGEVERTWGRQRGRAEIRPMDENIILSRGSGLGLVCLAQDATNFDVFGVVFIVF